MTSYSKKSLLQKLGIKEGMNICILNEPDNYKESLGKIPYAPPAYQNDNEPYDFVHFFTKSQELLKEEFPKLKKSLKKNGMIWISWPKGACNIATDLNENIIRTIGLKNGLVDVKVISIDEVWSGLKFVYRLKDRA